MLEVSINSSKSISFKLVFYFWRLLEPTVALAVPIKVCEMKSGEVDEVEDGIIGFKEDWLRQNGYFVTMLMMCSGSGLRFVVSSG